MVFLISTAVAIISGLGIKKGAEGVSKVSRAKTILEEAKSLYSREYHLLEERSNRLYRKLECVGREKKRLHEKRKEVLRLLKRINDKTRMKEFRKDSYMNRLCKLKKIEGELNYVDEILKGAFDAAYGSYLAYFGSIGAVSAYGTASTGTAISALSGAAADNAILAWFGGGALASGGGGMALGTVVLSGIAAAPAIFFIGYSLSRAGEKALTQAEEFEAKVALEVEKMRDHMKRMEYVEKYLELFIKISSSFRRKMDKLLKEGYELLKAYGQDKNDSSIFGCFSPVQKIKSKMAGVKLRNTFNALVIMMSDTSELLDLTLVDIEKLSVPRETVSKLKEFLNFDWRKGIGRFTAAD